MRAGVSASSKVDFFVNKLESLNAKNFQGQFLMALALTPDRSSHMLHLQRHKDVKLKIDLGYKAGDDEILIAYSIYDRFITIDGNRKVTAV